MSKRTLSVSLLTAGLTAGVLATAVGPAAAQGQPVGGQGDVYFLSGAANSTGIAQKTILFGNPGDEVYFGDWDGDGVDTPMVRRNGNVFYTSNTDGSTANVFVYGNPGDKVLIGNWDGKAGDSIAVRRGGEYFVKNDNQKSGIADTTFLYGDAPDQVLVGDWDGDNVDTLIVRRAGGQFLVSNKNASGIAEYTNVFGNDGQEALVGDFAIQATATAPAVSADGKDQVAIRNGFTYSISEELDKAKSALKTATTINFGEVNDTVFVSALPTEVKNADGTPVINTVRPQTYAADTAATHAAGDPVLVWNGSVANGYTQATDSITGKGQTYAGGEAVTAVPGLPQVYRGGEGVLTADGKAVVYVAANATTDDNHVSIASDTSFVADSGSTTSGTVAKYKTGEPVLNADGTFVWVKTAANATTWTIQKWGAADTATTKALPTGDANKVKVKVGDQVIRRAGEAQFLPKGSPAVYGAAAVTGTNGKAAGDAVVLHGTGDVVLNPDGSVARTGTGAVKTYSSPELSTTEKYQAGTPILHRKGEVMSAYKWVSATPVRTLADGATTNASQVVTSATANFGAGDVGAAISGTGIPAGATIVSVNSATSVNISVAATAAGTAVSLTVTPVGHWDNATTASNPITDDEDATLYTSTALVNGAPDPAKAVTKLDANNDSNVAFYAGTEQYLTVGATPIGQTVGGELIGGHKAGEPVLDANGNVQMTGDGKATVITGDGLGVRRFFG